LVIIILGYCAGLARKLRFYTERLVSQSTRTIQCDRFDSKRSGVFYPISRRQDPETSNWNRIRLEGHGGAPRAACVPSGLNKNRNIKEGA
jgi:hypothetical protein